ncbi:MAG: glycogen/starch/alpha-glucan phosphorylase, partial [bacterium]
FFTEVVKNTERTLAEDFACALEELQGHDFTTVEKRNIFKGIATSVRQRLMKKWVRTQKNYREKNVKETHYLSMEFLMGRLLSNTLLNLGISDEGCKVLEHFGYDMEEIKEEEPDMGLGNGGLGRLAACFLDSMASQSYPARGYGIYYNYGIFTQSIKNKAQYENPDMWLRYGCPWEISRPERTYKVKFGGTVVENEHCDGKNRFSWIDTEEIEAAARDIPIPGYRNDTVNTLRLWKAQAVDEFILSKFNSGNYSDSVKNKNEAEHISRVLYPNDDFPEGKKLRLKQQYFFVSATLQDIIRDFFIKNRDIKKLHEKAAVQLNDTHPAIAVPELMRILMVYHDLSWDEAWETTQKTLSYTNHTVLPEALEKWGVEFFSELLPLHLRIIEKINSRFIQKIRSEYTEDNKTVEKLSILEKGDYPVIRMAALSVVGSHKVNGVSKLHTEILKNDLFRHFNKIFPEKICNVTNGITPRRWLMSCNPALSSLITETIGSEWKRDLRFLCNLKPYSDDANFRKAWEKTHNSAKESFARWLEKKHSVKVDRSSLFDVHIKRFHEYKRQLLNILHVIARYFRIKDNPDAEHLPRTVFFAGKAAPGYTAAKRVIKLINFVAETVNNDPDTKSLLKVVFIPDYSVSTAEKIVPAADLSEQISTAGYEASGTGNMKFMLNGALTIGTMDGANVEMAEEVGKENMFIFGLSSKEVIETRKRGYKPNDIYRKNEELKRVLDALRDDLFNPGDPGMFRTIFDELVNGEDPFMLCADFQSYLNKQEAVNKELKNRENQLRKSILNTASAGVFSSDISVSGYAEKIWDIKPCTPNYK